jgi:exosortase/archaeosortase
MSSKFFYKRLAVLSCLTIGLLFSLSALFPLLQTYANLGWLSFFLFLGITVLMYIFGQQAINSTNKMLFTNVSLAFILLKMMLSVMILVLYKKIAHPTSNVFVIPFFLVYFIFTIFETYLMLKLTRK